MSMNDSPILQINIESSFDGLPKKLSVAIDSIDISRLTLPDDLFDIQTPLPDTTLFNAINPPVIIPDAENTYTIIDGCKRYQHHKSNNRTSLPCMIITTPCDTFTRGLLRIALNLHRPTILREQYLFLSWLKKNCPEEGFTSTAQKAGFSPRNIEQLLQLYNSEDHVKDAVFEGTIDLSLISLFEVFTVEDQLYFLTAFKDFKFSMQTQRELLDWLPEIAYTGKTTISEILSAPKMKEILENSSLNRPQKIQKIHAYLYTQKFPRLSEAQIIWKKQSASCNPDTGHVTFTPYPFFEKNQLDISISVTTADQATEIFKKLSSISQEEWAKLLYPLRKN